MRNMTSNILLSRAAKYVEKNGLGKGKFICDGKACILGSLIVAKYGNTPEVREDMRTDGMGDSRFNNAIVKSAVKKLAKTLKISFTTNDNLFKQLAIWNDVPARCKSDVVKALKASITR